MWPGAHCQCMHANVRNEVGAVYGTTAADIALLPHHVDAQFRTVQNFQIPDGFSWVKRVGLPDAKTLYIRIEDPYLRLQKISKLQQQFVT